jgi:hypothetical protein
LAARCVALSIGGRWRSRARIVEAPLMGYAASVLTSGITAGSAIVPGGLALLLLSCGGGGGLTAGSTAPVTTIELSAPADPAASAALSASPAPSPLAPSPSEEGKAVVPEKPRFVALFALVFRSGAPAGSFGPFGGDSIMLFQQAPVTCDEAALGVAAPSHIRTGVTWKAGERSTFQQFVFQNGKGVQHSGSIEVLSAPANKGDVGQVRLHKIEGANVLGGDIDALVCE